MDLLGGSRRGKMGTRIYLFLVGKMGLHACTGTGINSNKTIENRNGIEDLSRTVTETMGFVLLDTGI